MDRSHEILNGLKNLIGDAEEDGWDLTHADTLNKAREAYGIACDFFGVAPLEGDEQHQPVDDEPEVA